VSGAVTGTANFLYGLVFGVTGIHDMGMRFAEGTALSIPDTIVRNSLSGQHRCHRGGDDRTQLLGVRLATLAMIAPIRRAGLPGRWGATD
jgi:hypothetical protein